MQSMTVMQPEKHHLAASMPKGLFRKKGLLLIDDDEFFCALFKMVGESLGIPVQTYGSLSDMQSFAELRNYDVAVLDYYLESFRGPEIAEYIDIFFTELPVVLISGGELKDLDQKLWPACIRRFVPKADGAHTIIKRSLEAMKKSLAG